MSNGNYPIIIGSLTVLGGLLAWREYDRHREHQALLTGNPAGTTTAATPGAGAVVTVGDLAAVTKQNQIDQLRRDLSRCWNDIDVAVVQANTIKNTPVPPDFANGVMSKVWADCRASNSGLMQWRCNTDGTGQRATAAVAPAWEAEKARQLQPIQARLSQLNSEQLSIINNLRALGYEVPAGEQKKVSV